MKNSKRLLAMAVSAALAAPMAAYATNGMNLEGYGPIATGMGGASMAYDNGTAAMMNNPATIGLGEEGDRIDVALGVLGPNVDASYPDFSMKWPSKSDSFLMPAFGWTRNEGKISYGAGVFAQGGMGTEYKAMAPGAAFLMTTAHPYGGSVMGATPTTAASDIMGWEEMSEVGVVRILAPFSYQVNDQFNFGASISFVRATMDLKMAMTGAMMSDMMDPTKQNIGTLSGTMVGALQSAMGAGQITDVYGAQFDFADNNDFGGKTEGTGFGGKLGFTYQVTPKLTVGGSYHSETSLSDLDGDATVNMAIVSGMCAPATECVVPVHGKVSVKDFQWPSTMALGIAFKATDKTTIVADVKQMNWSEVMKDFKLSFTASDTSFADTTMDAVMFQNWDDQTAIQIGVSHELNETVTLRAGANIADNPVPDATAHYLFPAIVEEHYTVGAGIKAGDNGMFNMSLTMAPEVKQTNGMGMVLQHEQMNYQIMYSMNF